jgi:hypothetical protein
VCSAAKDFGVGDNRATSTDSICVQRSERFGIGDNKATSTNSILCAAQRKILEFTIAEKHTVNRLYLVCSDSERILGLAITTIFVCSDSERFWN